MDIHSGCCPVLSKNIYKRDKSSHTGSDLKFDIVKVRGDADSTSNNVKDDVITVAEDSQEEVIAQELMRWVDILNLIYEGYPTSNFH